MTTWYDAKICDGEALSDLVTDEDSLQLLSAHQPGENVFLDMVDNEGKKTMLACKIASVQFNLGKVMYDLAFKIEGTDLYCISHGHRWGISKSISESGNLDDENFEISKTIKAV